MHFLLPTPLEVYEVPFSGVQKKVSPWVLVTTCDHAVVATVKVDELFEDADVVDNARLLDEAMEIVELCGRMAMEFVMALAIVGTWDLVRRRNDSGPPTARRS